MVVYGDGKQFDTLPEYQMYLADKEDALRDYFAGQALAGILTNPKWCDENWEVVADAAYNVADAMIVERKRGEEGEDGS